MHEFNDEKQVCFYVLSLFLIKIVCQEKKLLSNWNLKVIIGLLQEEKQRPLLSWFQMIKTRVKITQKQNACTR